MEEVLSKIMEIITNPQVIMVVAVVAEFAMRLVKTEKPMSVIRMVANAMKGVGKVLIAVSEFADKVLPQKLKHEELK
jgi:uncharacterized membrane protein (UPF0136 family)